MKRKTKKRVGWIVGAVAVVLLIGSIVGIGSALDSVSVGKKRNPDNLITIASIKSAGIELGKSMKSTVSDVTMNVSEKGVVKLTGRASADDTIVYANVTLKPGVYRFTGAESSSGKTYEMYLVSGDQSFEADSKGVLVVNTEATYTVEIRIYEDCEFGILGEKLFPVIWEVEGSDDKTVVEFWK